MNAPTLVDERACEEGRGDRRRSASLPSAGGAGRRGLRPRADGRPRAASRRTRPGAAEGDSMLVAGVDSSTQSTKVLLCDAADGTVIGRGSAPHPAGTECNPAAWWAALLEAGGALLERAAAVGVVTDRGDASGTGYFSPATGKWLPEVAAAALGHPVRLPRVASPGEAAAVVGASASTVTPAG